MCAILTIQQRWGKKKVGQRYYVKTCMAVCEQFVNISLHSSYHYSTYELDAVRSTASLHGHNFSF